MKTLSAAIAIAFSLASTLAYAQPTRMLDPNGQPQPLHGDSYGNLLISSGKSGVGYNRSATITTTAQNVMAANSVRKAWKVQNFCTVDVYINFYATATAVAGSGNIKIAANGGYMANSSDFVETNAMSAITASATCALTVIEG